MSKQDIVEAIERSGTVISKTGAAYRDPESIVNSPNAKKQRELLDQLRRDLCGARGRLPCDECGSFVDEFTIPNDIWNFVIRPNGKEHDKEYLCVSCWHHALRGALGLPRPSSKEQSK